MAAAAVAAVVESACGAEAGGAVDRVALVCFLLAHAALWPAILANVRAGHVDKAMLGIFFVLSAMICKLTLWVSPGSFWVGLGGRNITHYVGALDYPPPPLLLQLQQLPAHQTTYRTFQRSAHPTQVSFEHFHDFSSS